MNLEEIGLVEMSSQEVQEIDGGMIDPRVMWGVWKGIYYAGIAWAHAQAEMNASGYHP